jgi:hypothetical protein
LTFSLYRLLVVIQSGLRLLAKLGGAPDMLFGMTGAIRTGKCLRFNMIFVFFD